jgi:4-carboxymuconolactone decarboxylase
MRLPTPAYGSAESDEVMMGQQPNPARERVRAIVPKMIELSEQVIYGDIWERPRLSKRDRSSPT